MLQTLLADVPATPTLVALVLLSVVALALGMERAVAMARARRRLAAGRDAILGHLPAAGPEAALAVNGSLPPHPATALFALVLQEGTAAGPSGRLQRARRACLRNARRRLWILGSIGALAPFVGLMGTVVGIMEAFRAMAGARAGGLDVVGQGISEALVTTAAGIFVAIEAVLFFNYLQVAGAAYAAELRDALEEIGERRADGDADNDPVKAARG